MALFENTRRKIAVYSASLIAILTLFVLGIWLFDYGEINFATTNIAFTIIYFGALSLYLRKGKNLEMGIIFLHAGYFVLAPIRIAQTGGLNSPGILAIYAFHALLAFSLNSKKFGYAVLVWNAASIAVFALAGRYVDFPQSPLAQDPLGVVAALIIGMLFLALPVLFLIQEKNALARDLRDYEKKRAAYLIMRRLAHEFGNALNISINYLILLKDESNGATKEKYVKLASRNLKEMDKITKGFVQLADENDLVEFLKKAEDEIKIITKLEDDPDTDI